MLKSTLQRAALLVFVSFNAQAAVDVVCGQSWNIVDGQDSLKINYCANLDINQAAATVNRVVIVIHGSSRNADDYFLYARDAGVLANNADLNTAIVAPQFLADEDIAALGLSADNLYWSTGGWKIGNTSNSDPYSRPFNISSFEVVDLFIERLSDANDFPAVTEVVVAGHSAGGQFVHRYAAGGQAQNNLAMLRPSINVRYVVANPSSYLYFSNKRASGGSLDSFARPKGKSCPEYNDYKYGLRNKNGYMNAVGDSTLLAQYPSRNVAILLGAQDNDPDDSSMDNSCEGQLQGSHRLERGQIFHNHALETFGAGIQTNHSIDQVSGVGHSGRQMLQSDCGMAMLFDWDPSGDACPGDGGATGGGSGGGGSGGGNGNGGGKGKNK